MIFEGVTILKYLLKTLQQNSSTQIHHFSSSSQVSLSNAFLAHVCGGREGQEQEANAPQEYHRCIGAVEGSPHR